MISRAELESLGMTDRDLETRVRELFEVDVALAGAPDDETTQSMRSLWLAQVQAHEKTAVSIGNEPIGSYGETDPEHHFGGALPPKPEE